jgi:IS1 family transposase
MDHNSNIKTIHSIFYAYFHSIIKYGIIFGCNSSNSWNIFILHKKIVKIVDGARPRTTCRSLFQQLDILHAPCQYILPLTNFINNKENFQTNASTHNINAWNKHHIYIPNANLSCFQKTHSMLAQKFSTVYHLV